MSAAAGRTVPPATGFAWLTEHRYLVLGVLGAVWLLVWYVLPIVLMLGRFVADGEFLRVASLSAIEQSLYLRVYTNTFKIALVVTAECLILGYIAAYALYILPTRVAAALMALVLVPFWVSIIVRTYALLVVLGRNGLVNQSLIDLGVVSAPLRMMFTTEAVYIGMAQALLPFMVLSVYSALRGIDPNLPLAARALGAGSVRIFTRIVFPLSLPGVWGGSLLVFILALGYFITPALVGGPRDVMVAQIIHQRAVLQGDFAIAILMSVPLLVITLALVAGFNRYLGLDRIWGGRA